jgi:hypothetical protein
LFKLRTQGRERVAAGLAQVVLTTGLIAFGAGAVSIGAFFAITALRKGRRAVGGYIGGAREWRVAGIAANAAALIFCAVLVFLFVRGMPDASAWNLR